MRYSINIERTIHSLAYCLNEVNRKVENIDEWEISINAGGIDYGIYFNFDVKRKELEICNQPKYGYDDSLYLSEIIDEINEYYGYYDEDDEE